MVRANWYRRDGDTLTLLVRVQPRAARDRVDGPRDGRLGIRVAAPPVDNAANTRLIALLAKAFRVPKSSVCILGGRHSRDKRVAIAAPREWPEWWE